MLIYCDLESGPGTYDNTMVVNSLQEAKLEPESSSESSSEDESIPPMDNLHKYYYDNAAAGSLVTNMCNLSVESEDDDEDDLTPTPARQSIPNAFESDNSDDTDSDNSEIENNQQDPQSGQSWVFNSNTTWYEQIKKYLAQRVKDDLQKKTQWVEKCYWEDSDDADADADGDADADADGDSEADSDETADDDADDDADAEDDVDGDFDDEDAPAPPVFVDHYSIQLI